MKRALLCISALVTSMIIYPTNSAQAIDWTMSLDAVTLGITGVSPHVERINSSDRIWRSDGPSGTVISDCNEAGICTPVTVSGQLGNDFAIITFANGTKRAYFKDIDGQNQQVYSAPCLDAGCTGVGTRTATSSDMRVPLTVRAWGVPDPVLLPDGRVRIYIVESPVEGKCLEKIATYISSDGVTFTKEPGWRLEGGYVDTEVLKAKDGDWLMIMSDIACTPSRRQEFFLATSKDGLSWSTPEILVGAGVFGLDPVGYELSPGVYRIYFAQDSGSQNFQMKRGTLKYTAAEKAAAEKAAAEKAAAELKAKQEADAKAAADKAAADLKAKQEADAKAAADKAAAELKAKQEADAKAAALAAAQKKATITCVKGKLTKKVTAVNPKCPAGYKKK